MRRPDPYQERARELAREAGLDPDGRVERPGQRSMPIWCTYRDAARQEHLEREAQALSATIGPQPDRFQNSPLKIFGQHDAATIAQMRNCMAVGNVVSGVICADGHLATRSRSAASLPMKSRSAFPASASTSAAATWPCVSTRLLKR